VNKLCSKYSVTKPYKKGKEEINKGRKNDKYLMFIMYQHMYKLSRVKVEE